ncbi:soma ferritin-like [Anopheles cruzii]|uniref:soma ferritin-like n=1 Tax=Anopheles cruzii TaxID=68878 RepID=UPI0022EC4898|nr:soma ferritin-like [Anopheles cruzii]
MDLKLATATNEQSESKQAQNQNSCCNRTGQERVQTDSPTMLRQLNTIARRFSSSLTPAAAQESNETSLLPDVLSTRLATAIGKQINEEHTLSYTYRSMSYHFASSSVGLLGLAAFYRKWSSEELQHGERLADFLVLRNSDVILAGISKPVQRCWADDIGCTIQQTIAFETKTAISLSQLYRVAQLEQDVVLMDLLTVHFMREQCSALRTLHLLEAQWHQLRTAPGGIYFFDKIAQTMSASGASDQ